MAPTRLAGIAESLTLLGLVAPCRGEYALARSRSQESLETYRELGDTCGVGAQLDRVGLIAFYQGDVAAAQNDVAPCLLVVEVARTIRQLVGIAPVQQSLSGCGHVSAPCWVISQTVEDAA